MTCGCTNTCGCNILDDGGVTTKVVQKGDTFTIFAIPTIAGVADTNCIALDIDEDKILTAEPIFADSDSVLLTCTPTGIDAEVIVDPSSTAIVSTSAAGLKVDIPPTPGDDSGNLQPGDFIPSGAVRLGPNRVEAYGQELRQVDYPEAYDALTLFSTTANVLMGSAQITGLPVGLYTRVGMTVIADGFTPGATIISIDDPFTITLSTTALFSVPDSVVRILLHGTTSDDTTYFRVPDLRGDVIAGLDNMGGTVRNRYTGAVDMGQEEGGNDGTSSSTIIADNLPPHEHPVILNDDGHSHPLSLTDPGHDHRVPNGIGFAGRTAKTTDGATAAQAGVHGHKPPPNAGMTSTNDNRLFVVVGEGEPLNKPLTQVTNYRSASLGGTIPAGLTLTNNDGDSLPVGPPEGAEGAGGPWAQGTSQFTNPSDEFDFRLLLNNDTTGITGTADIQGAALTVGTGDDGNTEPNVTPNDPIELDVTQPTRFFRYVMVV